MTDTPDTDVDDTEDYTPPLFVIEGGLSEEKAAANKVIRKVHFLNEALAEAWELSCDVTLIHGKQEIKLKHGLIPKVTLEIV